VSEHRVWRNSKNAKENTRIGVRVENNVEGQEFNLIWVWFRFWKLYLLLPQLFHILKNGKLKCFKILSLKQVKDLFLASGQHTQETFMFYIMIQLREEEGEEGDGFYVWIE